MPTHYLPDMSLGIVLHYCSGIALLPYGLKKQAASSADLIA